MLGLIEKVETGYICRFERHLKHSNKKVWAWLTENEKLAKWFSKLTIDELRKGGLIKFDMQDGTFEEMEILELKTNSILEFTWGEDIIRFELYPEPEGCLLVLNEKMKMITAHTPKDLAGWHVCLDAIQALIDGKTIDFRTEEWKKWYEKYLQVLERIPQG